MLADLTILMFVLVYLQHRMVAQSSGMFSYMILFKDLQGYMRIHMLHMYTCVCDTVDSRRDRAVKA
jgi:hypothetical protein